MNTQYDADVIIVGAGILGALAADQLARRGKSVLMIEAGPRVTRWQLLERFRNSPDKNNYEAFFPELPWAPKNDGGPYSDRYLENDGKMTWKPAMLRVVGGTTWHWSSAFWRLLPNEFKMHSVYGQGRDWAVSYDELEPWYTLVEQITGCSGNSDDDQSGKGGPPFPPRSAPYPLPMQEWTYYTKWLQQKFDSLGFHFIDEPHLRASAPYNGRPVCCGNNNCSPLCPIGAMYTGDMAVARAEAAGAQLIEQRVVYRLEKGEGGRIAAAWTMTPDGTKARLSARYFIIAAHAIETPKLMLLSDVGNSSGQVGRNLMSHPSQFWVGLVDDEVWPGRGPVQQGGANDRRDTPDRARASGIRYLCNQNVPNLQLTNRLIDQGYMGRALDERIRHDAARYVSIVAGMEQLPRPENQVRLGQGRDSLGLPVPRITIDIDDYTRAGGDIAQADFARFDQAFGLRTPLNDRTHWGLAAHIMGSTIMGSDPRNSVVDGDCRSYDHSNLFVANTSVFASSSVVNPTLTGAALALRSADIIGREI